MSAPNAAAFSGDIPAKYDRGLGPVLFVTYGEDLAARLDVPDGGRVLELAAGTGILTEILARRLGPGVSILATDLNEGMLAILRQRTAGKNVAAEIADAGELPYPDASFDALTCQFGVMFFPDKVGSFREARRVLKPRGKYIFNVWDSAEKNDFARCADEVLRNMFPEDPPKFYQTPFGFHDTEVLENQLREAGFAEIRFEYVPRECYAESLQAFCEGLVEGNPIVMELQMLGPNAVEEAKDAFHARLAREFGDSPFKAKMQAIAVEAVRP